MKAAARHLYLVTTRNSACERMDDVSIQREERAPAAVDDELSKEEQRRREAALDDLLAMRARDGSSSAFAELVRRHQASMLGVARRDLGDRWLASDAVQETFVAFHRALPTFEPQGKLRGYLFTILIRKCHELGIKAHARKMLERAWLDEQRLAKPSVAIPGAREHPLDRAMQAMDEPLRSTMLLRYSGGLELQEIADALDCPLGTVKSRLAAGKAKLCEMKNELRDELEDV